MFYTAQTLCPSPRWDFNAESQRRRGVRGFSRVEHVDHVERLRVFGWRWVFKRRVAESQSSQRDFRAGAVPQTPNNVESQVISSHLGYGVKPHLPINLCVSAPLR